MPPLLAVFYAFLLVQTPPAGAAFVALGGVLFSMFSLFCFGYVVNDIFDVEQDRTAGRPNDMAQRASWQRAGLCLLFGVSGFMPWLWLDLGRAAAILLAVNYLLPLAYSVPPLRLKERGFMGIACDAVMVHALPTLFAAAVARNLVPEPAKASLRLAVVAAAWALFHGMRGIVIHQLQDRESDGRAGVRTLATDRDPEKLRRLGCIFLLPLEVLALAATAVILLPFTPLALLIMIL
jgi:4-hydroxybenzoate polyprenyltransferase